VSKDPVQRPRHSGEIQRVDEQRRISDLPAAAAAHEAPELLISGPSLPRRLLLKRAERSQVTLSLDDLLDNVGTERADQLVLQVLDAHVEAEPFHVGPIEVGAEAGPLEASPKVSLLGSVTQARQSDVEALRAEQLEEPSDVRRSPHRNDGDALDLKVPTSAFGQCFERELVADPFNQHDRTCAGDASRVLIQWLPWMGTRTVAQSFPRLRSFREPPLSSDTQKDSEA
jgi:hypothetical protein